MTLGLSDLRDFFYPPPLILNLPDENDKLRESIDPWNWIKVQ